MENYLYNPDQKNKNQLKEEFVVRTEVLADILSDLENSDMTKPEQHYLLVGQRGTGKTTMLLRLRYAIEDSEKLNTWLIPIGFNEELYSITQLSNLWEHIAEYLEDNYGFDGLPNEMEAFYGSPDFEEKCYEALEKALNKHGKKVVLLIDNIGDLFKKFDMIEVRRLREILQTKKYLRLIAGSPFYLDTVLDYAQPFFEFFKVKRLDGLNEEESRTLLLKLGDIYGEREKIERIIKETPQRIETLRILSSGVPRTIALLFQIFIDHEHESSLKDLMRVLDAVTPLYKHRMDDLPTQQQKIVDAVARNWDAISVKELRERTKLESKVISAQLRQLEKNQVIEKRETGTKNHIYLLQDRFWNIWYLMRNGRKKESERVVWLVRFLESWCTTDDFEKRIANYVIQIKEGKLDENAKEMYGQVYASLKNLTSNQKFLLKNNIDKDSADIINITEEDAIEEALKLSNQNKHLDALKAILESDDLSEDNKKLISYYIEKLELKDLRNLIHYLGSENYVKIKYKGGYVTAILESISVLMSYKLLKDDIEEIMTIAKMISFVLEDTFKISEYESSVILRTLMMCLMRKHLKITISIFEELEHLNFIERNKSLYIAAKYLYNNENQDELKLLGSETLYPTYRVIDFLKGYWKKNETI